MTCSKSPRPAPLELKPDLDEAARRWDAFYHGEILDRPLLWVTAPRAGKKGAPGAGYHEKVFGDMDDIIGRALVSAEAVYWAGESVPTFWPSFGPDEIAVFCGAELCWNEDSKDTNWSKPFVEDWADALPLRLRDDHPLWRRMLEFYRRCADRMAGKMLTAPPDLHTNTDLLAAVRGPERLCLDLMDRPEAIDEAMLSARAIFPQVWDAVRQAGRMDELGYCHGFYSMQGAAVLQCDFSCMVSPEMFARWILPALEEEAEIVGRVVYHWDGPGALVHTDALVRSKGLHTLSYVPGAGRGGHADYMDLFNRVQAGGKAVQVYGSPEQIKAMHRELKPEKTFYCTGTNTEKEADELLEWFRKNT